MKTSLVILVIGVVTLAPSITCAAEYGSYDTSTGLPGGVDRSACIKIVYTRVEDPQDCNNNIHSFGIPGICWGSSHDEEFYHNVCKARIIVSAYSQYVIIEPNETTPVIWGAEHNFIARTFSKYYPGSVEH